MNENEVVSEFQKNSQQKIRIILSEFKGKKLIHIRLFYQNKQGEYRPTLKGVAFGAECYPDLKRAIQKLEETLIEQGLLDPDDLTVAMEEITLDE